MAPEFVSRRSSARTPQPPTGRPRGTSSMSDLLKGWGIQGRERDAAAEKERVEKERRERVERANRDPEFFCRYYLADSFKHPRTGEFTGLATWQQEVLGESETDNPNAYAAPRGHGKTTFLSFGLTLRDLIRLKSRFTVYISSTFTAACDRIAEIRTELETNDRIREDYGDLLARTSGSKAQAADLILANGARIVAKGTQQSIRGLKNRQHRPDRIICDDVDKDAESASGEQLEKRINWFKKQVMGLQGAGGCKVIVVGNIIGPRTLLTECLANPKFTSHTYRAIDWETDQLLMPGLWTRERLEAIREIIGETAFETEYNNNPPAAGTRPFRAEWLQRRWTPEALAQAEPAIVIALDLSKGKTERSDYQSFVAIRRDAQGRIYIVRADLGRRTRKELAERAFTFSSACDAPLVAAFVVEANGFQEWFAEELAEKSALEGHNLPIIEQDNRLAKFDRISKLSPLAEGGRLLWPPDEEADEHIALLRRQTEEFPDGRHDDGPDALAMAVEEMMRRVRGTHSRMIDFRITDRDLDPYEYEQLMRSLA
ncbi:hypothetical protein GC173_11525 [bacterium]|nr:hypothetical protein [bacterium]